MTAIEAVSTFIPTVRTSVDELAGLLRLSGHAAHVFRRFYGLHEARVQPTGTLGELMVAAARNLDLRGREGRVRYVIHARTIDGVEPYPVCALQTVRAMLGLRHATAFAVTDHACASGILAVDVAGRLLAQDGDPRALALILAGEKTFTPVVQVVPQMSIMGEGAAAVLVRHGGATDRMLTYATHTYGQFNRVLDPTDTLAESFRDAYVESLADVMSVALEGAGMRLVELDLVLPHNVNRISWVMLCKHLGYPLNRVVLDNVATLGHCFCADPFINYATAVRLGRLRRGDRYLMASVGLGGTFSAMLFEH